MDVFESAPAASKVQTPTDKLVVAVKFCSIAYPQISTYETTN